MNFRARLLDNAGEQGYLASLIQSRRKSSRRLPRRSKTTGEVSDFIRARRGMHHRVVVAEVQAYFGVRVCVATVYNVWGRS